MDFDEYEYLEKTVENPEAPKAKETANGVEESVKSSEKDRNRSSKHRSDDKDDEREHRSKRSKSGEESRDQDRRKERGSSGRRSRSRDGERDRHRSSREHRDRDREERNGKERERERDRDKDKERRERDREGDREKDRDKERERERSRRSRSHSERHRSELDERERSRDGEFRERDKEKEKEVRDRDRESRVSRWSSIVFGEVLEAMQRLRMRFACHHLGVRYARAILRWSFWQLGQAQELRFWILATRSFGITTHTTHMVLFTFKIVFFVEDTPCCLGPPRRPKEKKEEMAEPEADPERDQRTVFAYQISLKADERDVYEFFSRAGKVRDVRLIMDRNSRRSKGVGYIEFYDVMSVPMAIALSGQPLLGQPVMVKPSEAEKNLVQSTAAVASGAGGLIGPYSGGARRLYVFGAFGPVELVQLPVDETGQCKGFGFVQFSRLDDARNALSLNGQLEIGGRTIKVSAVTDQVGAQELGGNTGDFDDDDGAGLALNARSRALLMQKLDRSGTASNITGSLGTAAVNSAGLALPTAPILGAAPVVSPLAATVAPNPALAGLGGAGIQVPAVTVPSIDTIGAPSECLQLKNMFDPASETEPDFDFDIKDDVQDECSKFGHLKHIYVDKNSAGFVYLRFEETQAAVAAQRALHGRWFAGKMITASFMLPQDYEAKFPDSR
ncbi:hypothetical protein TIFTF001_007445 [Ficus carica]|uniref:RRM domain-containing protein n=1 Tax=Ficus carica TaxID=3494 RepID=A0AA87ZRQ8_FICCA|nr:hypothetical protein TIFTF001_007445 [Ficus carica]